jgi:hypothetical protein
MAQTSVNPQRFDPYKNKAGSGICSFAFSRDLPGYMAPKAFCAPES